ncbi:MAG: cytochrome c biogenesis protein [Ignavibacteria bacterium]|nr:cytochrome c biogenesis protein [Ignavibacteria bacterium]
MNRYILYIIFILFLVTIVLSFTMPIPEIPLLGQKARIIFYHVPTAWLVVIAFLMSMINSILYLKKQNYIYDIKALSAAELGFLFSILATITGSIWAKFSWGSFWNWDPRETSIFFLFIIYGAYFALRSAIDNPETKAKLAASYSIIAFITVPFFVFVIPRLVESLHPDPIINTRGQLNIDFNILIVFIISLISFTLLFFWVYNLRVRIEKLYYKNKFEK